MTRGKRIQRKIDSLDYWINRLKNNEVIIVDFYVKKEVNDNFLNYLLDTNKNTKIDGIYFGILDNSNEPISLFKILVTDNTLDEMVLDGEDMVLEFIEHIFDYFENADLTLLSVYLNEDEKNFFKNPVSDDILMLTTKLYRESKLFCYIQELVTLYKFEFYDEGY